MLVTLYERGQRNALSSDSSFSSIRHVAEKGFSLDVTCIIRYNTDPTSWISFFFRARKIHLECPLVGTDRWILVNNGFIFWPLWRTSQGDVLFNNTRFSYWWALNYVDKIEWFMNSVYLAALFTEKSANTKNIPKIRNLARVLRDRIDNSGVT